MQSVFAARVSHASNDPRPPIARTQSAVTYDPRAVAAQVYVVSALTDRIDPYTVIHDDPPMVAALYVQTDGAYYGLEGVDPWDEARDARLYGGPHPVVAHPPCGRWCRLAKFVEAVYGHRVGDDGGCFAAALMAVRRYGGVLEHPAHSIAWDHFGLPEPKWKNGWTGGICGGFSAYIEQQVYGELPVKKATWLYAYGVELPELRWRFTPDSQGDASNQDEWGGMHGWRDKFRDKKSASRTSPQLRDTLLSIARTSHVERNVHVGSC